MPDTNSWKAGSFTRGLSSVTVTARASERRRGLPEAVADLSGSSSSVAAYRTTRRLWN
jgi:hypothetical protein